MYASTLGNTTGVRLLICFTVLMLASIDICFAGESEAKHEDTEKSTAWEFLSVRPDPCRGRISGDSRDRVRLLRQ